MAALARVGVSRVSRIVEKIRVRDQRTIGGWADKMCVGTEVSHCAIIRDIGASIRAEPDVERAVERVQVVYDERLIAGAVAREVLNP